MIRDKKKGGDPALAAGKGIKTAQKEPSSLDLLSDLIAAASTAVAVAAAARPN